MILISSMARFDRDSIFSATVSLALSEKAIR